MSDPNQDFAAVVEAAAKDYDADIYFYSGGIDGTGVGLITEEITRKKSRERAVLILVTNGGLANDAYQIARLFQRTYSEFVVFCPSRCKSAGTLLALGAHRLIMDVFSELGPLDVQLIKQNEIFSRKSGLLAKSSFDALGDESFNVYEKLMMMVTLKSGGNVSFQVASELAAKMTSTMFAPVFGQIDPEIVGSEKRDLMIAYEYGVRLVKTSKNATEPNVLRLVSGYPSHDFIIDSEEARELFVHVEEPKLSLYRIVGMIGDAAYDEASATIACALTGAPATGDTDVQASNSDDPVSREPSGSGDDVDVGGGADRPSNSESQISDTDGDQAPDLRDATSALDGKIQPLARRV